MDGKEFKKLFNGIASVHGFKSAFGGWFKESDECLLILELMKSNFGGYYKLNIKVFIQGMFGRNYIISKDLVRNSIGNADREEPKEYASIFDLEVPITDDMRSKGTQRGCHASGGKSGLVMFRQCAVP